MTVWDEALGCPVNICFASTRGWSYPAYGSSADATPEIVQKYNEWNRKKDRRLRAGRIVKCRKMLQAASENSGVPYIAIKKWWSVERPDRFERGVKLLTTNLRSPFRKSLRNQLVEYLMGRSKPAQPFSNKQWDYV